MTEEQTPIAEETTAIDAKQENIVFVPLFKNVFEKNWRNLISYKPWFKKKDWDWIWTFPVGLWNFHIEKEGDFEKKIFEKSYWTSVSVNEDAKKDWDLVLTLCDTVSKEYYNIYLFKRIKDWKVSFGTIKPEEIEWKKYWINLTKNLKEDKPQEMNLVFNEADWASYSWGSEATIDFDENDF